MPATLAGCLAFVYFIAFPTYLLRWLDQRSFRRQGFVVPKVSGYIECMPCKTTALVDPGAYLIGQCPADEQEHDIKENVFLFSSSSAVVFLSFILLFIQLTHRFVKNIFSLLKASVPGCGKINLHSLAIVPFGGGFYDSGVLPEFTIFSDEGQFYGKRRNDPFITYFERHLGCNVNKNIGVAVAGYGRVVRVWKRMVRGKLVELYESEKVFVTSERRVTEVYRFIREKYI